MSLGLVADFGSQLPQWDGFAQPSGQACGRFGDPQLMGFEFVQKLRNRLLSVRDYLDEDGRLERGRHLKSAFTA